MNKVINYPNKNTTLIHQSGYLKTFFNSLDENKKYLIVTDSNIYGLYKNLLNISYNDNIYIETIPAGEENKNFYYYKQLLNTLCINNFTKSDTIIAFGGGMISDLSLFVSSTYQRGMDIILIPTTLLAMVDASIGGKCGINLGEYKNQVGTYYFPSKIIIDESVLNTLAIEEFNNGLAEVIKYAIIKDEKMFNDIENNNFNISDIIDNCINIKLDIIKNDIYDASVRKLLNFGHTYGHMLESCSGFDLKHGYAVAIGMYKETTNEKLKKRIYDLLSKYFDLYLELTYDQIKKYLIKDKKISNSTIDVIEITEIGKAKVITKKVEELIDEYIWEKH